MSEKKRCLAASTLFKKRVIGEDKKKLGTVVNIIFDTKYFDTRILIFPAEETKLLIRKLIDSGKEITGDIIKELSLPFPDETNEVIKKMIEKGKNEAIKIARDYLTEMQERLKKIYYLVPITEIVKVEKKSIVLERTSELYEGECCNMEPSENDVALYGENAIPDVKSLLPITLNLVKIRGEIANDPNGKPGRITNLQLDLKDNVIDSLIIQTIGRGSRKCLVNPNDFDFSTMETNSKFEDYTSLV